MLNTVLLANFRPQSKLVTKTTLVNKPKFPVIDAHNHLGEPFGGGWNKKPLSQLLDLLDEAGVRGEARLRRPRHAVIHRFVIFQALEQHGVEPRGPNDLSNGEPGVRICSRTSTRLMSRG